MRISGKRVLALFGWISIGASLILFNIPASRTSSTKIYVDPPTIMALYNTDFTVNINIEDVTDLYAWQVRLKWDPNLLEFLGVDQGDFVVNQSEGWAFLWVSVISLTGSGTLRSVTFHGENLGGCVLDLTDTRIFDSTPISVPAPPNLGDVDGNGRVNMVDNGYVAQAFGSSEGQLRYNPDADFNKDGVIDVFDLLCVAFNFGQVYPAPDARNPEEITHNVDDGYVNIYSQNTWTVTWKWLDYYANPVWLNATVAISTGCPIADFAFNRSLGEISFNFTSSSPGSCNVSIPKLLIDGAFKVLINGTETSSILTWNKTHTSVCFTYDQGNQNVAIVGEIVTRIRNIKNTENLPITDVNGDGIVNILDISAVAVCNKWEEDC